MRQLDSICCRTSPAPAVKASTAVCYAPGTHIIAIRLRHTHSTLCPSLTAQVYRSRHVQREGNKATRTASYSFRIQRMPGYAVSIAIYAPLGCEKIAERVEQQSSSPMCFKQHARCIRRNHAQRKGCWSTRADCAVDCACHPFLLVVTKMVLCTAVVADIRQMNLFQS